MLFRSLQWAEPWLPQRVIALSPAVFGGRAAGTEQQPGGAQNQALRDRPAEVYKGQGYKVFRIPSVPRGQDRHLTVSIPMCSPCFSMISNRVISGCASIAFRNLVHIFIAQHPFAPSLANASLRFPSLPSVPTAGTPLGADTLYARAVPSTS